MGTPRDDPVNENNMKAISLVLYEKMKQRSANESTFIQQEPANNYVTKNFSFIFHKKLQHLKKK